MDADPESGPLRLQRGHELVGDAPGIGNGNAGVHADHGDMRNAVESLDQLAKTTRRHHQRIAARQDHLPDRVFPCDVVERRIERAAGEGLRSARAHDLPSETEAAVDGTHVRQLEEHAVGIAVHDAFDRAQRVVPDRIGAFLRPSIELGRIWNELARDWIVRIGRIDQLGESWGQHHRIARRHCFELGEPLGSRQSRRHESGRATQCFCCWHDELPFPTAPHVTARQPESTARDRYPAPP